MSASSNRPGSTTSDTSATSPLARAPKFSPPTSQNVSPPRRPLRERSSSQSNQFSGPTIRLVDDTASTNIYSKHPFPTEPSQILPPRNAPGYAFERRGRRVSDHGTVANAVAKLEASHTLVPAPLQHKKAIRHSAASTSTSEADTFVASSISPSTVRFSQDTTPPSSPSPPSFVADKVLEVLEEAPSPRQRSTIRAVTPSNSSLSTISSAHAPAQSHALNPRASAASLDSSKSVESSSANSQAGPSRQRASSNLTVRPLSPNKAPQHTPIHSLDKKQASSSNTPSQRPHSPAVSLAFSDITSVSEEPAQPSQLSPTLHESRTSTLASGVRVNYPAVRAPSANSLWAGSQELPSISSRMNSRHSQVHQWSSQLSTIHSESERDSRSIERTSYAFSARSQSQGEYGSPGRAHMPRRRGTVGSTSSSDNHSSGNESSNATTSSVAMPLPLFSPITRPSQDEKEADEVHDTISPLQSPPLRMKRSGFLRRDSDARSTRSSTSSRPTSSQSDLSAFVANNIPGWARAYYRRGERVSLGAPESVSDSDSIRPTTAQSAGRTNTPSEGMPLSIYRPRNRPHERMSYPETLSMSDGMSDDQNVYVLGPQRRLAEPGTPRLRQDRRSQARLSAWKAPSFDENLGSMLFSRQNRQIVLFCLGFLFPFAWMIAACLPLPPDPEMPEMLHESTISQMDVERRFTRDFGPAEEDKSFQKAKWWRNLNRVMSGLGTLLVGAIIALAILASRMK